MVEDGGCCHVGRKWVGNPPGLNRFQRAAFEAYVSQPNRVSGVYEAESLSDLRDAGDGLLYAIVAELEPADSIEEALSIVANIKHDLEFAYHALSLCVHRVSKGAGVYREGNFLDYVQRSVAEAFASGRIRLPGRRGGWAGSTRHLTTSHDYSGSDSFRTIDDVEKYGDMLLLFILREIGDTGRASRLPSSAHEPGKPDPTLGEYVAEAERAMRVAIEDVSCVEDPIRRLGLGLRMDDDGLVVENPVDPSYRTAIRRKSPSVPIRFLHSQGLLVGRTLDYGCGWGADADTYGMDKYDPDPAKGHAERPEGEYDTITVTYVLNAQSSDARDERAVTREIKRKGLDIIRDVQGLLSRHGNAYLTVRRGFAYTPQKSGGRTVVRQSLIYTDLPLVHETGDYAIYSLRKGDRRIGYRVALPQSNPPNPAATDSGFLFRALAGNLGRLGYTVAEQSGIAEEIWAHLQELNAGDTGMRTFGDAEFLQKSIILRYEGFTDECWSDAENRGLDLSGIESEVVDDWLKRHPGTEAWLTEWTHPGDFGEDNVFYAILGPSPISHSPKRVAGPAFAV